MIYRYQKPLEPLKDQIKTILILEGLDHSVPSKLPLVTTGMSVLFCKIEKDANRSPLFQFTLFGTSAPRDCWMVKETTTIIAYFFNPFMMSALFNVEAKKLKERPVELHEWSVHKSNALRTQLLYADSTAEILEILDHLLHQQLKQQERECELIRKSTDEMLFQTDAAVIKELLRKLGVNPRTFQRLFKKYVGVSPTQYRRICQFQLSFAQLRAKAFSKLSDVAYENGFSDQSHFNRTFREFTQTTPYDYLASGLKKS